MPFDHPAVGAALQETLSELVLRLGPIPVNPPALRRLINWPGRSARAAVPPVGQCLGDGLNWCLAVAADDRAGAGLGCQTQ